jgi:hypothetical protein
MLMDVRMCECIVCMKEKLINEKEWHRATKPLDNPIRVLTDCCRECE